VREPGLGMRLNAQLSVITDKNSLRGGLNIQKRELGVKGILISKYFQRLPSGFKQDDLYPMNRRNARILRFSPLFSGLDYEIIFAGWLG
jgi:hypothetical protein